MTAMERYLALRRELGRRRGWIWRHPALTCGDAVWLARSWSRSPDYTGCWRAVVTRIRQGCAGEDPRRLYPHHVEVWKALYEVANAQRNADATSWRSLVVHKDNGQLRVTGENARAIDIEMALFRYFGELRGWETYTVRKTKQSGGVVEEERRHPATTCHDVAQLAAFWTAQVAAAPRNYDDMVPGAQRARWEEAAGAIVARCAGLPGLVPYPDNRRFWRAMQGVAIACDTERNNVPTSKLDVVIGAFGDALETVVDAVADAGSWAAHRLSDVGAAVGKGAGSAAGGFLDQIGLKHLLLGAGAIAGAVLIVPRLRERRTHG